MQKLGIVMVVALATAAFVLSDLADAKRWAAAAASACSGRASPPAAGGSPRRRGPARDAGPAGRGPAGQSGRRGRGGPPPPRHVAVDGSDRRPRRRLGPRRPAVHFGLPEGLGSFLLLALLVVGAVVVVRMLMARRTPPKPAMQYAGGTEPSVGQTRYQPDPAPSGAARSGRNPPCRGQPRQGPSARLRRRRLRQAGQAAIHPAAGRLRHRPTAPPWRKS